MRRIFAGVPSIYGFSGAAPVGPTAAMLLNRYFDGGGGALCGQGSRNSRLLSVFSRNSMTRVPGAGAAEAAHRARICRFFDERTTPARKLRFVHELLREGDIGAYLKRIESLWRSFSEQRAPGRRVHGRRSRSSPRTTRRARASSPSRARRARPAQRARMIELAPRSAGSRPSSARDEEIALVNDILAARRRSASRRWISSAR